MKNRSVYIISWQRFEAGVRTIKCELGEVDARLIEERLQYLQDQGFIRSYTFDALMLMRPYKAVIVHQIFEQTETPAMVPPAVIAALDAAMKGNDDANHEQLSKADRRRDD